jgi:hypothetical protein
MRNYLITCIVLALSFTLSAGEGLRRANVALPKRHGAGNFWLHNTSFFNQFSEQRGGISITKYGTPDGPVDMDLENNAANIANKYRIAGCLHITENWTTIEGKLEF